MEKKTKGGFKGFIKKVFITIGIVILLGGYTKLCMSEYRNTTAIVTSVIVGLIVVRQIILSIHKMILGLTILSMIQDKDKERSLRMMLDNEYENCYSTKECIEIRKHMITDMKALIFVNESMLALKKDINETQDTSSEEAGESNE